MKGKIAELRQRLKQFRNDLLVIQERAKNDERDLTPDELTEIKKIGDDIANAREQIASLEYIEEVNESMAAPAGRQTEPENPSDADDGDQRQPRMAPPKPKPKQSVQRSTALSRRVNHAYQQRGEGDIPGDGGFRHFGSFAQQLAHAQSQGGDMSDTLRAWKQSTDVHTTTSGAEGGYFIPEDFSTDIMTKVMAEMTLLSETDQQFITGNTINYPTDQDEPWSDGGLQAYWTGEGKEKQTSQIDLDPNALRLQKLTVAVKVTDELLEDANALDGYLRSKVAAKMNYAISRAIMNGDGAGKPLGVINAPATVVQAKEAGQAAATVEFENITKMYSRMFADSIGSANWYINQSVLPRLMSTEFGTTGTAVTAWMPPGQLADAPHGMLMGRPIRLTQACPPIGSKGDITFADLSQYLTIMKASGIRSDVSIHAMFLADVTTFRFVFRMNGQPWWSRQIQPAFGNSETLSCFVTLEERA